MRRDRAMAGVVGDVGGSSVRGMELIVRGGKSGRNEFLRGPFALIEAHSRAKFVGNLIKHGWASMSPPELIPPPSPPAQGFRRGLKTQAKVFAHRTWSAPGTDCL